MSTTAHHATTSPPVATPKERALDDLARLARQLDVSYGQVEARVAELTGQLEAASLLRQQEIAEKESLVRRHQSLLDLLPGGVVVIDGRGIVDEANPAALDLLGADLVGRLWRDVIAQRFAPRGDDGHEVSLRDGRRVAIATRSLESEPGQLVLLTDLTETRRLQEQLARHQRLSSLGRMVASLAHQVRTPLSAALIYASHLQQGGLNPDQQSRFAGRLKARLEDMERQVRDMLVFARGDLPLTDRLTPTALLAALRSAAEPLLQGIEVRWQCDVAAGELLCNPDTLVGALCNLLDNARQAAGEPARLKVHVYRRRGVVRLCVSDNGMGIAPAVLARLGEPFFTTKASGTGLGLAVAMAVARAHHGELQVRSRLGRGTCVWLSLPLIAVQELADDR